MNDKKFYMWEMDKMRELREIAYEECISMESAIQEYLISLDVSVAHGIPLSQYEYRLMDSRADTSEILWLYDVLTSDQSREGDE